MEAKETNQQIAQHEKPQKEWLITLLLALFAGVFGIHRFYTGHIVIGLVQFFTGGGCGIWYIVDIVLIATKNYTDSDGRPLKE